jgi:hypothetical protein
MKTAYFHWVAVVVAAACLLSACGGGGGNPGECQGSDEVCKRGSASAPSSGLEAGSVAVA